jgi:hypothetical protein
MQRFREIEEEKQHKAEDLRKQYEGNSSAMQIKVAQIREARHEKSEKLMQQFVEREKAIALAQQQKERERARAALLARILRERKAAAAQRAEKQKRAEKEILNTIFAAKLERIHNYQAIRAQMRAAARQRKYQLEQQKMAMDGKIQIIRASAPQANEGLMTQLAQQFHIDIDQLRQKVEARRRRRQPLPPLRPPPSEAADADGAPADDDRELEDVGDDGEDDEVEIE